MRRPRNPPPPSYHSVAHNGRGQSVASHSRSPTEEGYQYLQGEDQPLFGDEEPQIGKSPGFFKRHLPLIISTIFILILGLQSTYIYANDGQWKKAHERQEKKEREEQRKLIQWAPLKKDQECLSYGTARYQAHLEYVPPLWDQFAACLATPALIHRKDLLPTECRRISETKVLGIWVVDFEEPACKPWWRDIKDHGCTSRGSGIHRYEGHLEGYLEPDEFKANWAEMCATTPHTMFGRTYNSPTQCKYWPDIGVYGFWEIPDDQCT